MFEEVDDTEVQKLSAELDSISKALDDMTFVHAPHGIKEMIKRHETMAKEYPYQKTIQDMIRQNLVGGEFVIMMMRDRGKSTLFKL